MHIYFIISTRSASELLLFSMCVGAYDGLMAFYFIKYEWNCAGGIYGK